MLFDAVVRYGTECLNSCYGLRLGEPVPNTPYATTSPSPINQVNRIFSPIASLPLASCLLPLASCLLPLAYSLLPTPYSQQPHRSIPQYH
ncbi:hypothetical protein [Moorena producens]|uniref:hypothetical protein n=1 Tax=Moorena producens TaxID=1155739 RepID=UPI0011EA6331|nr:hypothetical protein [Moorena producens]